MQSNIVFLSSRLGINRKGSIGAAVAEEPLAKAHFTAKHRGDEEMEVNLNDR